MNELPLRDIHLPEAVSWWPLAIGWWLLPLLITVIAFTVYKVIQRNKHKQKVAYRKMALKELNIIRTQFSNEENSVELIRSISSLLRRVALSYLPRENIASLTGKLWIEQLNKLSTQNIFTNEVGTLLERAPYQANSEFNQKELLNICEQWINALPETAKPEPTSFTGVTQ